MPPQIIWTEIQDDKIKSMRADGAFWDVIGAAIGVNRSTAIARGREIGAALPEVPTTVKDDERLPLPPGHSTSWGAITDGTSLDGAKYPHPVFQ